MEGASSRMAFQVSLFPGLHGSWTDLGGMEWVGIYPGRF